MNDFENIYDAYNEMVYNVALNYVQQIEDAEEITQDVFLKVFKRIKNFDGKSTLKTWVYRITINASLDFIRKKKRRPIFQGLFYEDRGLKNFVDIKHPGIILEQKEAYNALFRAMNRLPGRQKTVILLLKAEGLSIKEAAAIMNLKNKALESLFHRAKQNFLKEYQKEKDEKGV